MFLVYNCVLTALAPIWIVWMVLRARVRKEAPNWPERQGQFTLAPRKDRKRIWIHAVSVGEVIAALPILREVRRRLPDYEIVLSVTTSSGHQTAREQASELFDHLVYAPIDVARFTLSAMQKVQPAVLAIMETELWMNLLWAAKTFDCRTLLINGRISDRSFPRARLIGFYYRALLKSVDRCLMQSDRDAERITALGGQAVDVLGNCKFDQAIEGSDADVVGLRREMRLDDRPLLVIGSTRGFEEEGFVLDAIQAVGIESLNVIHAPRHVESADALAKEVARRFGSAARRSLGETGRYLILDTYGELSRIYAVADIVIVGGGFAKLGGQNIIQPLAQGKPVLHGPHMANFRDIAREAEAVGASQTCSTTADLAAALDALISDPVERTHRGEAAKSLVLANLGASSRYADAIATEAERFQSEEKLRVENLHRVRSK